MPFKDYVDSETKKPVIILSDLLICSRCGYEEFSYERNPANLAGESTQYWIRICNACGDRIAIIRKFKNPETSKGHKRYVLRDVWERMGGTIKEGVVPVLVGVDYDGDLDGELKAEEPKLEPVEADSSKERNDVVDPQARIELSDESPSQELEPVSDEPNFSPESNSYIETETDSIIESEIDSTTGDVYQYPPSDAPTIVGVEADYNKEEKVESNNLMKKDEPRGSGNKENPKDETEPV